MEQRKILHWGTAPENLENIIMLHYTNFDRNIPRVQAMLSASPTIAFWYPRLNVGVQKQWLEIDYLGNAAKLGKPIPFVGFGNTFKIPKGFMATLDYNYTGKGNQYIYELMKPTHQLDISLRKSFLNDALSIEDIECNDIRVEQIDNQIEKLKKTKEKAIADCEKKINLLMKSLNEMKDREAENFDKEIHYLELEKEFILKEINGEH